MTPSTTSGVPRPMLSAPDALYIHLTTSELTLSVADGGGDPARPRQLRARSVHRSDQPRPGRAAGDRRAARTQRALCIARQRRRRGGHGHRRLFGLKPFGVRRYFHPGHTDLDSAQRIREWEIDPARAHGAVVREKPDADATSVWRLLRQRPLLIFAGAVLLLQLANAAMLPLMAGVVTTRSSEWATVLIAACIVVPQAIVALTSPSVGRKAQQWGRRPLLMLGFAALATRGLLFATVTDPYLLVAVQIFDGITAAVFAVMIPLVVADVAFGSGHFSLAQGIVGTATGIGASLSTVLAGYAADRFGSSTAFMGLAAVAAVGLALIWLVMPETRRESGGPVD